MVTRSEGRIRKTGGESSLLSPAPTREPGPRTFGSEQEDMMQRVKKPVSIKVIPCPWSNSHVIASVGSRGRIYAVTYAEPFPSEAEVRKLWVEERTAFYPYDESAGRYLR